MKESAACCGRHNNLIGIVSEPESTPPKDRPNMVILGKTGPFRMNVDLARALGSTGFRVLRIDPSGFGDSKARLAAKAGEDVPIADLGEAMDFLAQSYQASRFVLLGFCAGSDKSHRASVVDDRVVGVVHLDGLGYPTPAFYVRHYTQRLLSWRYLQPKIAGQLRKILGTETAASETTSVNNRLKRSFPPIEQTTREFAALMKRDVRLLYVYTRYGDFYSNYAEQMRDAFPSIDFGNRLTVERYPNAHHTFPLVRNRAQVIDRIVDWMNHEFPGQSIRPPRGPNDRTAVTWNQSPSTTAP
jgi:pimeloyl-ACP methyl ester carboxylesterase